MEIDRHAMANCVCWIKSARSHIQGEWFMSTEDEVRTASQQFYAALNNMANGDASAMSEIWSHDAVVTAMHPVGGRHVGWDEVRDSFQQVAQIASEGRIRLDDQMIQVTGAMAWAATILMIMCARPHKTVIHPCRVIPSLGLCRKIA